MSSSCLTYDFKYIITECVMIYLRPDSKKIFNDMASNYLDDSTHPWPYFRQTHEILINVGLDRAMFSKKSKWLQPFFRLSLESYKIDFLQDIDEKVSLQWYRSLKSSTFGEKYLFNIGDFYGARLKFMARVGCLGLSENLCRWGKSDGNCELCTQGKENLLHFLFTCPKINLIRIKHYSKLERKLKEVNKEFVWWKFMSSSLLAKLCMFLGSHTKDYGREIENLFDLTSKQFLAEAWQFRHETISLSDRPFN